MSAVLVAEGPPPLYDTGSEGLRAVADGDALAEAWEAVDQALDVISRQVLAGAVDDPTLAASVERLQRLETKVAAEKLRRIAELDSRSAAPGLGARSTEDLLSGRLGLTRGEAKAATDTATALRALPKTAERMRTGDIGVGKVQTVARTMNDMGVADDAVAELDELVADEAPTRNRTQLKATVETFAHEHGSDLLAERERKAWEARRLRRWTDQASGLRRYDIALPATQAAIVDTAIDAAVARARHREAGADDNGDPRPLEQRAADALVDLAQHSLGCPEVATVAGGQTQVLMITTVDTTNGVPGAPPAELDGYGAIGNATARMLLCDAEVTPVTLTRNGAVLDAGRSRRDPSPRQRAAVIARDRRCIGCGAPVSRCQIHHVKFWDRDHGPTDESNLCLLCWNCHHHVHHHGWDVVGDHITGFSLQRLAPPRHSH